MADSGHRHWLLSPKLDAATLENALSLALDVLDGHEDARVILADLVEEAGNARAAELARSGADDDASRLAVVLGVLPSRAVLVLGADFLEHILVREPNEFAGKTPYLLGLQRLRAWCRRELELFPTWQVILLETSTQGDVRTQSGHSRSRKGWDLGDAMQHLAEGIRAVLAEYGKAPVGCKAWFDKIGLADIPVTLAAESVRQQLASRGRREEFHEESELEWQVTHLCEFLTGTRDSLSGSGTPWT